MELFHSFEEADHAADDLVAAASRFELTAEFRQFVIRAAIEAPSGDNMQPWRFRWLPDGELEVYIDSDRTNGVLERTGHAPLISVGAVLENIAIAASSRGARAEISLAAKNVAGAPVAVVHFEEGASDAPSELAAAIFERRTDRGVYDLRRIPLDIVAALAAAGDSERPDVRAVLIAHEKERHGILDVCSRVDAVRFGNKTLHEEFFQKLQFGNEAAEAREGLTEQSLGISKSEARSFAALKPWGVMRAGKQAGLHRFMANKSKCVNETAPLLLAIVVRNPGVKNSIRAGRVMQRVWLRATEFRLGLQPISILPLLAPLCEAESDVFNNEEREAILAANEEMKQLLALGSEERLAFLVRIGFPVRQGPKNKRRAPHEFMIAGGTESNDGGWDYEIAVSRHTGLITPEEQRTLRSACIAIAGLGGVGGSHLITLARLGVGNFHLADFDRFECANFNRQHGAMLSSLGKAKIDVMAALGRDVNPELGLRLFPEGLTDGNLDEFLNGADLVIDGLDFFEIDMRRKLFAEARRRGLWVITAGPHGAGAGWIVFSPHGMDFDTYFDFKDEMSEAEKIAAFAVGLVPRALHLKYVDLKKFFSSSKRTGGSLGLGCNLASGIAAAEAMKILLNRPEIRPAPWFGQFDAYRGTCVHRRLRGGNRHPLQLLKRRWLVRKSQEAAQGSVPGPRGLPFVGSLLSFMGNPLKFHEALAERFQDSPLITFRLGKRRVFALNSPAMIEELFVKNPHVFSKDGVFIRMIRKLAGENLFTRNGEDHLRSRRLCQAAYTKNQLRTYAANINASLAEMSEKLKHNGTVEARSFAGNLALKVIALSLFSISLEDELDKFNDAVTTLNSEIGYKASGRGRFSPFSGLRKRKLNAAVKLIDAKLDELLSLHAGESAGRKDIVSVLKNARDENGEQMSPEEIRAEAYTVLVVGQESIATSLSWSLFLLGKYPEIQEKIFAEVRNVAGERELTFDDIESLRYTECVLRESMRLYPPVWVVSRVLDEPYRLGEHTLPKGSMVVASQIMMHRNPRYFPAPFEFKPERWLDAAMERTSRFSYFPFGLGRRVCIGKSLADMEGILALASICRSFSLELLSPSEPECNGAITLQPKDPLYLRTHRRWQA